MQQIFVFPNTGHHYSFVPIAKEVLSKTPKLKPLCDQDKQGWRPLNYPWIRGRFASKDGTPGLWVAIESNMGTIKRGSIFEPRREVPTGDRENPTPYATTDVTRLPKGEHIIEIKMPVDGVTTEVVSFQVVWKEPAAVEPINVDLVVDFGNTRSVVLALEDVGGQRGKLTAVCRPIRFMKKGWDYQELKGADRAKDTSQIIDSWFVLHETMFSDSEPPAPGFTPVTEIEEEQITIKGGLLKSDTIQKRYFATARVPQMFVELSPVVMGDAARDILATINLKDGGNYTLSSPKRYAWDRDPVGRDGVSSWTMVLNRWNPERSAINRLPQLAGSLFRFLPLDGSRKWDISSPPNEEEEQARRPRPRPEQATYSRGDSMIWAALHIIETAYRQITSHEWSSGNQGFIPRRLRRILVTYPSGWSEPEKDAYQSRWQRAIDIFSLSRLMSRKSVAEGGDTPELIMDLDEAVASQLPFVYSEIRRMDNIGENWIKLVGRGSSEKNAKVRLMTIDIGGGTTDIAVVQYSDTFQGEGVNLNAEILFKDSVSIAGDAIVKEIIEKVLLPSIGIRFRDDEIKAKQFENFFLNHETSDELKAKWSRITKLVLVPIVRQLLQDLAKGTYGCPDTGLGWSPDRILGSEGRLVDVGALDELNLFARESALGEDVIQDSEPIEFLPEQVAECVKQVLLPVINSLAKYVCAFDVDLVTLSGKPSELPQVRELLEELLPIECHRIIQAKNFMAGDWYPMSSDNRINDAKTVTAVGAALYQAVRNGKIDGWKINRSTQPPRTDNGLFDNFWVDMPKKHSKSRTFFIPDSEDKVEVEIMLQSEGTRIGRMRFKESKPEQVYRFRWTKQGIPKEGEVTRIVKVTLQRFYENPSDEIEQLKLVKVESSGSGEHRDYEINVDVELQPCTLDDKEFWLDSGNFQVMWS
jgi:Virulence factor SrfB